MNSTTTTWSSDLPPLPPYTLTPRPNLIPGFADQHLALLIPVVVYWAVSLVFHLIDTFNLCPQYRLHTPAELLTRNHASRWEVFRDVLIQQLLQTIVGLLLNLFDEPDMIGKEEYNLQAWALRFRWLSRVVPVLLTGLGLDAKRIASRLAVDHWQLAGVLRGGHYPGLLQTVDWNGVSTTVPSFAPWEMTAAKAMAWVAFPAFQFFVGIVVMDTWQYFWHRWMHVNKWMYTTFHARHHRLYVPYAYGALYNTPGEALVMDIAGGAISYLVAGMSTRQSMLFYGCSTWKTVDDHCGYRLPFDPLQLITSNNAAYHDVHHQSWGIKTNFSQPFFTVWDRYMGTMWAGGDVSARYERTRRAAEAKMGKQGPLTYTTPADSATAPSHEPYEELDPIAANLAMAMPAAPAGKARAQAAESRRWVLEDKEGGGPEVLAEEAAEEERELRAAASSRRSPRKRSTGNRADSLKGLKDRVSGSIHAVGGVLVKENRA